MIHEPLFCCSSNLLFAQHGMRAQRVASAHNRLLNSPQRYWTIPHRCRTNAIFLPVADRAHLNSYSLAEFSLPSPFACYQLTLIHPRIQPQNKSLFYSPVRSLRL